jgi:hypothetical protein
VNDRCEVNENSFANMFQLFKKFVIPLSVATVLLLLVTLYFVFLNSTNVYQAIPDSAVAVIEINDWSKLNNELNTKPGAIELRKTAPVQKLVAEITFIQRFLASLNPELKPQVYNGKITISAHLVSADDFDYLFTIPANGVSADDIDKALRFKHAGSDIADAQSRVFKNQKIEDVVMKDGTRFSITCMKGVLILSYTSFLTETSVTAVATGNNLNNDKELYKVIKRNSNSNGVEMFVNFKKADVIYPVALKPEKAGLLNDIRSFQSWAGYDITFDGDLVNFSGNGLLVNETKGGEPAKNILASTIWNYVPDNAAYVNAGFNTLNTEVKATADENNMAKAAFKDWIGEARAFVTLEPLKEDFTEQNVFIIEAKDETRAITDLKKLIAVDGTKPAAADTFLHTEIFNLKGGTIINQVFGSSFTVFGNTFFGVSNHVAVFCNSADILKFVLEKISKGETLNKDATCRKAIEASGKTATGTIYINPAKASLLLAGMIKDGSSLQTYLSHQNSIVFEFNTGGAWNTTHGTLITGAGYKTSSGLLWKTKLQTLSVYTPQIVVNETTGEKEIFTQDTANNIYLLSKSGEVIFTKNIGEKIIGEVKQLDYYNNGQLQYIFNTPYHVFMLDRMGNDAASYPLRLSNAAMGGLTLVHGSGANYRYFVPCSNGAIYGYEANGRPLSGWSPKSGLGLITKPLQTFKSGRNEYLLAFNNVGKLMLLGSKGDIKWSVDNLPVTNQNFSVIETGSDFLVMNAAGNQLIEISSDGNDNIKPIIDSAFSFAATATSDTTYQYFFSGLHDVRSYSGAGEFKNAMSIKADLIRGIEVTTIGNTKCLLVKDESTGKVLIYDLSLNLLGEYPVSNSGKFAITDLLGRNEFIGIQPDTNGNVACYRIK